MMGSLRWLKKEEKKKKTQIILAKVYYQDSPTLSGETLRMQNAVK